MENVHGFDFDQRAQIMSELQQGLENAKQLQNKISNKTNISQSNDRNETLVYKLLLEKMMSTFDKDLTIPRSQPHLPESKRRKMMPIYTEMVQIEPGKVNNGLEGPPNDGFSWRKYGQKEILGARYPRGYYRCSHRTTKGCLATKQVQRCDEDPFSFNVVYRGEHTCYPGLS